MLLAVTGDFDLKVAQRCTLITIELEITVKGVHQLHHTIDTI